MSAKLKEIIEGLSLCQSADRSADRSADSPQDRAAGERIERNFAHQFDTGGLDRLYVRGLENVHKKFLIQAAACNLSLLLRSRYGSGKPRAAHDRVVEAILMIFAVMRAIEDLFRQDRLTSAHNDPFFDNQSADD